MRNSFETATIRGYIEGYDPLSKEIFVVLQSKHIPVNRLQVAFTARELASFRNFLQICERNLESQLENYSEFKER